MRRVLAKITGRGSQKIPPMDKCCVLGDPVLREKCRPVDFTRDASLIKQTVKATEAILAPKKFSALGSLVGTQTDKRRTVGLAAPQIGVPIQLFAILRLKPMQNFNSSQSKIAKFFLNPSLEIIDETLFLSYEGCTSMPGYFANVPRHNAVKIKYNCLDGKSHTEEFDGALSAVVQHEFDHLNGIMFIDRLPNFTHLQYNPI